jgi:hypothetical protein
MMQDPIQHPAVLQPKTWNKELMYPRYLFDSALTTEISKQFKQWWKTYYAIPRSPVENVKLRLVAKTNRCLETFFIHKKNTTRNINQNGNIIHINSIRQSGIKILLILYSFYSRKQTKYTHLKLFSLACKLFNITYTFIFISMLN